jgi:hypothetical protein
MQSIVKTKNKYLLATTRFFRTVSKSEFAICYTCEHFINSEGFPSAGKNYKVSIILFIVS